MPRKKTDYPTVIREKSYVTCPECKLVLISLHVHDYRSCPCFSNTEDSLGVSIDGGDFYCHVGWGNLSEPPVIRKGKFEINFNTGKYKVVEDV